MVKLNRTKLYLSPVLNVFPSTFIKEFNKVVSSLEGYFIYDIDYYKAKRWKEPVPVIFLKFKNQGLKWFLRYIRTFSGYLEDYPLNLEGMICVVIKIPTRFHNTYYNYLKGLYSKMYSEKDLKEIGINPIHKGKVNQVWLVCTKNVLALEYYKTVIKIVYDAPSTDNPDEYDIPPRMSAECLNWEKEISFIKENLLLKNI